MHTILFCTCLYTPTPMPYSISPPPSSSSSSSSSLARDGLSVNGGTEAGRGKTEGTRLIKMELCENKPSLRLSSWKINELGEIDARV